MSQSGIEGIEGVEGVEGVEDVEDVECVKRVAQRRGAHLFRRLAAVENDRNRKGHR